jgi:AraC-like DNA-binding protein
MRSRKPDPSGGPARSRRGAATEATIKIGAIWAMPEVVRVLGFDPADVFAQAGVDLGLFDDLDNEISFRTASRLFRVCVERAGCPHFGLLLGQRGGLSFLGLVGLLAKCSPDVGSALRSLVRYMHLHIKGAVTTLHVHGAKAVLDYEIYEAHAEATDQIGDAALATLCNIMRDLCGPQWTPLEVRLSHRRPVDVAPFRSFFRATLQFDAEENALVFPAEHLQRPLPPAQPELRRLLASRIEALEHRYSDRFPEQVRSILRTALLTDQGRAGQVAALLSMHSRTLHRRLTASHTSFRKLVDETRFAIARQMLEDTGADVGHVAHVLDYADSSAFTRAFRRWSGTTPAAWRQERRPRAGRRRPAR